MQITNKEIKQSFHFEQPPSVVWEYLTHPELLALWLVKTDFQLIAGHRFSFINKSGNVTECEILEIVPAELLSYSWKVTGAKKEITVDSKVVWTLSGKGGGTELTLKHTGFMLPGDFAAHRTGWTNCLNQFKSIIKVNESCQHKH
jgi:uncharacterized protein YndB with AHSA1/START domain